jgi:DDE family transposase
VIRSQHEDQNRNTHLILPFPVFYPRKIPIGAYNLGNFIRTWRCPKTAQRWSLTSLREKLIKIGAKVVRHGRYVTFQMAEVAVPQKMFQKIFSLIARAPPAPA